MSGKRKDGFSEAIVGLFMLAVLAVLVYFTVVISGVDLITGRDTVKAKVVFADLGGLDEHDGVVYDGGTVGTVEEIELTPKGYVVTFKVDKNVVLCQGYSISVVSSSMLGGHKLRLERGEGEVLPLTDTLFVGERPVDFMHELVQAARKLNDIASDPRLTNIVANVDRTVEDVSAMTASVRAGQGMVGKLLADDDTVYAGLETVVTNLAVVTTSVREGKGTLGKLLSEDDTVYRDLQRTLDSAATIAENVKRGEGLVGRLLAKDDPIIAELEATVAAFRKAGESLDVKDTVESANRLLANLNVVAERLRNGEGTIGKLLADDQLYGEIEGLTKDVRQVLDNFRDTTPITTFGSMALGAL